MPKLCNSGFWRLRRFPSYRLLTGPKVGNLYAQLPAAKCPACSRSEKKVKPGCKHEESRPARCGQNLGKSKSKMPQITALPYFNLWNDLFRLIFLKMLQTFFEPITKDSEKKKNYAFLAATWEFQLVHSFLVKIPSQKVEKDMILSQFRNLQEKTGWS